ncbi:MAG TPA: hypothetical protein VNH41_10865 [Steroidobacteraceae bacterium]|nr:hypothetical protein [Steroidobacteraceae bacterium]
MSDTTEGVDNGEENKPQSPPVAPAQGEPPVSTPAPVDPTEPDAEEQKAEEARKQSRSEARAFATLRRENRELYRRLGGLEAMLQQVQQPPAPDGTPQRQTPPPDPAVEELNRSILERIEDEGGEYGEVVEKIAKPDFPITVAMRDYLATSKNPAAVAKVLADDPKEARRISLLSDRAADRAMEQLEARSAQKPAPRTTRALPPVRTVGGSSSVRPDPAKMDMDDYVKWRNSQQR